MWVEKKILYRLQKCSLSSSLGGCELKKTKRNSWVPRSGHPPWEDVSWKNFGEQSMKTSECHPPWEDVSWKTTDDSVLSYIFVILLGRMWVEKNSLVHSITKSCVILLGRMWVEKGMHEQLADYFCVILLGRMWVEKQKELWTLQIAESSSLGGCELKIAMMKNGT